MPTPVYIICAESGVQDKERNLVSIFNVLERLMVQVHVSTGTKKDAPQRISPLRLWVLAVWRHEPGDEEREFESQFRMVLPDGQTREQPGKKRFSFDPVRDLVRFILRIEVADPLPEGVLRLQSLLREVGTDRWLTQEYSIPVQVQVIEDAPAESSPDTARNR